MIWWMLAACSGRLDPVPSASAPPREGAVEEVAYEEPTKKGIQLVLADGSPVPEGGGSERNTMGEPLADAATQALLKRTDPLEGEDGDRRTFRIPAETLAAPKTGDITAIAAPSVQLPTPEVIDGPARVLRFGPEGEVPQAPKLSLTFSQPMVAGRWRSAGSTLVASLSRE